MIKLASLYEPPCFKKLGYRRGQAVGRIFTAGSLNKYPVPAVADAFLPDPPGEAPGIVVSRVGLDQSVVEKLDFVIGLGRDVVGGPFPHAGALDFPLAFERFVEFVCFLSGKDRTVVKDNIEPLVGYRGCRGFGTLILKGEVPAGFSGSC